MKNRLQQPLAIMNDYKNDHAKMKEEFAKLDIVTLQRFKNHIAGNPVFESVFNIVVDVLKDKIVQISESFKKFNEDDGGGYSGGVAAVTQGSVSGMGNVVSAQPGVTPGTTGTTGSGDIGVPFSAIGGAKLAQKIPVNAFSPDRRKKIGMSHGSMSSKPSRFKGGVSDLRNLAASKTNKINDMKPTKKVMSFDDFSVDKMNTVTHVKEGKIHELISKASKGNVNKLHEEERESIMKHVAGKLSNFNAKVKNEKVVGDSFTIEFLGNKFSVAIKGSTKKNTFSLESIGDLCKFIKTELKVVKESRINEGAVKNVMQNLSQMTADYAEEKLKSSNLKLDSKNVAMLAQFIENKAESMYADGDLDPVTADEITLNIMNKAKLDEIVKVVNDILFDRN